jgi:hypothetical protein
MPDEDGRRMDEIRKFSAIYGRFDCKRKLEKPLSLHEVGVYLYCWMKQRLIQ